MLSQKHDTDGLRSKRYPSFSSLRRFLVSLCTIFRYYRIAITISLAAAYVTTLTYATINDQLARSAGQLVSSSKTKPCQFRSV